jgi:hypothetical protein
MLSHIKQHLELIRRNWVTHEPKDTWFTGIMTLLVKEQLAGEEYFYIFCSSSERLI